MAGSIKSKLGAALAILAGAMAGGAQAHPYWHTDIKLEWDGTQNVIVFTVPQPPPADGDGVHVQDIGLNWCAKNSTNKHYIEARREALDSSGFCDGGRRTPA